MASESAIKVAFPIEYIDEGTVVEFQDDGLQYRIGPLASTMPEIPGAWGAEVYILHSICGKGKRERIVTSSPEGMLTLGLMKIIAFPG